MIGELKMNWYKSQSDTIPELTDTTSSATVNYMRRNITEKTIETDSEIKTVYEYEEIKVNKSEWDMFQKTIDNEANIDYIAMMLDVEL